MYQCNPLMHLTVPVRSLLVLHRKISGVPEYATNELDSFFVDDSEQESAGNMSLSESMMMPHTFVILSHKEHYESLTLIVNLMQIGFI